MPDSGHDPVLFSALQLFAKFLFSLKSTALPGGGQRLVLKVPGIDVKDLYINIKILY
jgi:hypothetical protein